jgi:hypothetical protein
LGILEAYRRSDDSWWNESEWRRIDVSAPQDHRDGLSRFFAVAGFVLILDSVIAARAPDGDPIFGLGSFEVLSLGFIVYMLSAIIDLRKFRTMNLRWKAQRIATIGLGVWMALLWLFIALR